MQSIAKLVINMPLISPASFGLLTFLVALIALFTIGVDEQILSSIATQLIALIFGFILAFSLNKIPDKLWLFTRDGDKALNFFKTRMQQKRYYYIYSLMLLVFFLNFILNTNYLSLSPDSRFVAVKVPIILTVANAIAPLQILMLIIFPIKTIWFPISSLPWLAYTLQMISSLFVASSKSFVLTYLLVLYLCGSIHLDNSLYLSIGRIVRNLKLLRIPRNALLVTIPFLLIATSASLILLFARGVDIGVLTNRFANGFDQIFLLSSAVEAGKISREYPITDAGQPTFLLVWFKSYIRPFMPSLYDLDFDNYSEYIQYLLFGTLTRAYEDTGWAPNNSLFTDLFLAFPASIFMQFITCFLITFSMFTCMAQSVKSFLLHGFNSSLNSIVSVVFTSAFFVYPFLFVVNTQYYFTSIIIVFAFMLFANILSNLLLKDGSSVGY